MEDGCIWEGISLMNENIMLLQVKGFIQTFVKFRTEKKIVHVSVIHQKAGGRKYRATNIV